MQIKFGTDGWRAIIADDYTVENVRRVTEGTGRWMLSKGMKSVVIGHDCRFGGDMFANTTAGVLSAMGIKIYLASGFVSTPMISMGAVKLKADLGIVITASHNPPSYNGFKLKSKYGGPSNPAEIAEVEALIPETATVVPHTLAEIESSGNLKKVDLEKMYIDQVNESFDMNLIRSSGIKLAYDAMFGAGQNAVKLLLPDSLFLHCEFNPSFLGQAPEPIDKNLKALSMIIKNDHRVSLGLATDGDADRIGLFDEDGKFVDSHHILLLLLLYLAKYKGETGKVVITFSVTDKMVNLAKHFNLPYEVTKIGFKYIAEIMINEDVIVGGEESGGLAVKGHIPERDGIWIGLMVMEFMAATGKSLKELIQEVYAIVGSFATDRDDLHITEAQKQSIVANCKSNSYTQFGDYKVEKTEDIDGFKFWLAPDKWTMMRASGTEPVLRVYAQAPNAEEVRQILDQVKATILV